MPGTELDLKVVVDGHRARDVARQLGSIEPRHEHFMPRPRNPAAAPRVADFYLAWVGICQQTRTLEGVVGGIRYRGSDYLVHRLRAVLDEEPGRFTAEHLAMLSPGELASWLSDDGNPARSTADRLQERAALLNDIGRTLLYGYGGAAAGLMAACKGRLGGRTGLLERLSKMQAYRDPARKKSFLFVHLLRGLGLFEPADPHALGLPVDYHILRIFLRAGVLRLEGARAHPLLEGGRMSAEEDIALRRAAVRAGAMMARVAPLETLDLALWMVGRNCCFYEHPPMCRTGPCGLSETCSLRASTDLECGLSCPLDGACAGSRDGAAAAVREPFIDTDLY